MHNRTLLLILFALVVLSALFTPTPPAARAAFSSDLAIPGRDLLQFTAAGHVLGFQPTGLYLASGHQLVRIEFADTAGVPPASAAAASGTRGGPFLAPVTYTNLWNGISVTFQPVAGGIYESTYLLAPGASVAAIHLRYNIPVKVDASGGLSLEMPTGEYQESAPIAWQDIEGERVSVEVAFQPLAEREIGFHLGPYNPAYPLVVDPTLQWNTFLGSTESDAGAGIAMDASGYVYIVGSSYATWGSPKRPFNTDSGDAFVAKLNSSGTVLWDTFLGGAGTDAATDVALDSSGNIYVIGNSGATWGDAPKRPFTNVDDIFVAKLNNNGTLQWNTFLGGGYGQYSSRSAGIAVDTSGNVYAAGYSYDSWGTVNPEPFAGGTDGFVAKLGIDGTLLWTSFLGGPDSDEIDAIAVDGSGNVFVAGSSDTSWGSPVEPLHGTTSGDAFVAKLNSSGFLQWNTFLGSTNWDGGNGIALDANGSIYTIGYSYATWGIAPKRPFTDADSFVAKLSSTGSLVWNTFLGGASGDSCHAITVDASNYLYIVGDSNGPWGSPLRPYTDYSDAWMTKLDGGGTLLWNTFLGGAGNDTGMDSVVDGSGNIYVTGDSGSTWGSPLEPFHTSTSADAFLAVIRRENSTTTLTGHTPNPSFTGQTVTISYTVAAHPAGSMAPTGSVTVSDGAVSCSGTIAAGHCDLTFATAGTKSFTATYAGDTDFYGSSSATTAHQVNKAHTTTSITGHAPNPSIAGQSYTVNWTVSVTAPAAGAPTGTVTVGDGGAGTCTAPVAEGHCALVSTSPGAKLLTATFSGDSSFEGSSGTASHEVKSSEFRTYLPLLRR